MTALDCYELLFYVYEFRWQIKGKYLLSYGYIFFYALGLKIGFLGKKKNRF